MGSEHFVERVLADHDTALIVQALNDEIADSGLAGRSAACDADDKRLLREALELERPRARALVLHAAQCFINQIEPTAAAVCGAVCGAVRDSCGACEPANSGQSLTACQTKPIFKALC